MTDLIANLVILLLIGWGTLAIIKKYWEVFAAIAGGIGAVLAVLAYRRAQKRKPVGRHHPSKSRETAKPTGDTEFVHLTPGTVHFEEEPAKF